MKIVELKITPEDDFLGMDAVALVQEPAIESDFFAFKQVDVEDLIVTEIIKQELFKPENFVDRLPGESRDDYLGRCIPKLLNEGYDQDQAAAICYESLSSQKKSEVNEQFESYTDYPESATNAARRALEWRDSHPEQECGTRVGWARANQLANRQPISEETIARMASFARHLQHEDIPYSEGCGGLMVDAWGGRAGIEWAQNKLDEIRQEQSKDAFNYFDDLPEDRQDQILDELQRVGISEQSLIEQGYEIVSNSSHRKITLGVNKNDAKPDLPTNDTKGSFKVLYRYSGPLDDKNRKFCRRLLKLDLLFRKEDIDRLTIKGANEEFGYYDIFQYKGSYNCRHRWNKVYVYQKQEEQVKSTLGKETFSLVEDQRIVVGPLMIPDKLILRIDENGDPYYVYFSKETVKLIAEKLMRNELLNSMNLEHDSNRPVKGTMLETWVIEDSFKDKSALYGFSLPIGTWMGMYRIHDDEVWSMVKEGTVKGFSIEGFFADRKVQN